MKVPKEARQPPRAAAEDELHVEVENGRVNAKARPKNYTKHMLGLHSNVWKGVKVERYLRKEKDAWENEISSGA